MLLQALDLTVGGVQLLLMVGGEFGDRLLQEIDIALQAAGAPLHGLFDGADFDAGNVLRRRDRRQVSMQGAKTTDATRTIRPIIEILIRLALATVNLLRAGGGDAEELPH